MVAKRRLNFSTPASKRARPDAPLVIYRGLKPEMKNFITVAGYTSLTANTLALNNIDQGTSINNRIGAKVKIWSIDYVLAQDAGVSFRCDLLLNNPVNAAVTHGYDDPIDRNSQQVLKTTFHHAGALPNCRGSLMRRKLPYGVVSKYSTGTGTTINSNQIVARISSPIATTITGYFRVWYTDA